jgi:hypothetical protein
MPWQVVHIWGFCVQPPHNRLSPSLEYTAALQLLHQGQTTASVHAIPGAVLG